MLFYVVHVLRVIGFSVHSEEKRNGSLRQHQFYVQALVVGVAHEDPFVVVGLQVDENQALYRVVVGES